ncbi:hypothetical protein [Blastococcus tunisiensis]|uniref:Uncharacterized protein n=1 Tax=Blastococcus tunisiensis TaxID=1798228 RepID=A0A1I2LE41_9ACTN|nr:hypothetical protein [Blastococcus sp. DSM 46838]SFF77515.1 hypothetical protein SAMN05216574_12659 [Blastococcus sp. DSM 46838]
MATPSDEPDRDRSGQGADEGAERSRRRFRILVPLGIVLVVAALITYMLVVSQRGAEDESDIYNSGTGSTAVLVDPFPGAAAPV